MNKGKKEKEKSGLHPLNKHQGRYDFSKLISGCGELKKYVRPNKYNDDSIDFADPLAVKTLNRALLQYYYGIGNWDIPKGYLCPPIPGRADYIHHLAEYLGSLNNCEIPRGEKILVLDIGVGANCIYPIIGNREYGWKFVGADIDPVAIDSASKIVAHNNSLQGNIECKLQKRPDDYFYGIINKEDKIDFTLCNPPFHASAKEAMEVTLKKQRNLKGKTVTRSKLNFGGQNNELWCKGGEELFIKKMIMQSKKFSKTCLLFSCLVSRSDNLKSIYKTLSKVEAQKVDTLTMAHGNKISRVVVWSFLGDDEVKIWLNSRW